MDEEEDHEEESGGEYESNKRRDLENMQGEEGSQEDASSSEYREAIYSVSSQKLTFFSKDFTQRTQQNDPDSY